MIVFLNLLYIRRIISYTFTFALFFYVTVVANYEIFVPFYIDMKDFSVFC